MVGNGRRKYKKQKTYKRGSGWRKKGKKIGGKEKRGIQKERMHKKYRIQGENPTEQSGLICQMTAERNKDGSRPKFNGTVGQKGKYRENNHRDRNDSCR